MDTTAGKIHQLNGSASCIWNACDGKRSAAAIAAVVANAFDADLATVLVDVEVTLAELQRLGLLVPTTNQ